MRGFSVTERMVTPVLAVISLSLGIPGFRNVILNSRAATQALAGGSTLTGRADVRFRPMGGGVAARPWRSLVRQS